MHDWLWRLSYPTLPRPFLVNLAEKETSKATAPHLESSEYSLQIFIYSVSIKKWMHHTSLTKTNPFCKALNISLPEITDWEQKNPPPALLPEWLQAQHRKKRNTWRVFCFVNSLCPPPIPTSHLPHSYFTKAVKDGLDWSVLLGLALNTWGFIIFDWRSFF